MSLITNLSELAQAINESPELRAQCPEQFIRDYSQGKPKLELVGEELGLCRVVIDYAEAESDDCVVIRLKLRAILDNESGEFVQQVQGRSDMDEDRYKWIPGFNSSKIRIHRDHGVFSNHEFDVLLDYADLIKEIELKEGEGKFYSKEHSKERLYIAGNQARVGFDLETRMDPKSEEARFGLSNIYLVKVSLLGSGTSRVEELASYSPTEASKTVAAPTVAIPPRNTAAVPAPTPTIPPRNQGQDLVMPRSRRNREAV